MAVEEVYDTGEYETVYNLRVADFHTYFVGSSEWGFSVWAHNSNTCVGTSATQSSSKTDGIIYLRKDGKGGEYVGQANSQRRYNQRQGEHADDFPHEKFTFEVLERVPRGSGRSLNVAEEDWIRAGGGPGRLQNDRHQMNDQNYRAAGGTID